MGKYSYKLQPKSWEDKPFVYSNDTQAKAKMPRADPKILL